MEKIRTIQYNSCPKCGNSAVKSGKIRYVMANGGKLVEKQRWTCKNRKCNYNFTE